MSNKAQEQADAPEVEKPSPRFRGRFAGVKDLDDLEKGGFDGVGTVSKLFTMAKKPEAEAEAEDSADDEVEVEEIDLKNVDEVAPEIANLFIKKAPVLAAEKQEEAAEAPAVTEDQE